MEFHNGQLCIPARELTAAVMTPSNYKQLTARKKVTVLQRGGGYGKQALVLLDSLPTKYQEKVKELFPNGDTARLHELFRSTYVLDAKARAEFASYIFEDGSPLPADKIIQYTINASVIKAVKKLMANSNAMRKAAKDSRLSWEDAATMVAYFKEEFGHTLPESTLRFRKKVAEFNREGYASLISGKFQNQNSRKVNHRIERLLLSLDSLPERPYNTTVAEMYNQFICGELDVYDPKTGEMFDPEEFADADGEPIPLSPTTVANYLNTAKNRALRSKLHDTQWDYNNKYRPHHHRESPMFAFSKISMDDRDLPRKMPDGNRVKAYYAYDVASGCVIGYSYSRLKKDELFLDCVRSMFQLIEQQGWNCPAQVEVEHHIVKNYASGLMKAKVIFPFVRWCNPGNSQEKRAEHFNRAKKYGVEKLTQVGIGRWYSKLETNRPRIDKIYDEQNNTYKEVTYSYDQLVAEDLRAVHEYNNQLHPNQKMYTGLTRWDVLCDNQNPDLEPVDKAVLYRFIGEKTKTSIRRNMYCMVQGIRFGLPTPEYIDRLAPRNMNVEAYYMSDINGDISEVYLYQGDDFIAECTAIRLYQEAEVEKTQDDDDAYLEQAKYVSQFDAMIKREKIDPVRILPKIEDFEERGVQVVTTAAVDDREQEYDFDNHSQKALEDF